MQMLRCVCIKCRECSIPPCNIPDKVEREDSEEFWKKVAEVPQQVESGSS